jgi:hypothetical protein
MTEERRVEELADKLIAEGDPVATDKEAAVTAARRMVEDSDARTLDPEAGSPDESDVIHRSSREATETGGSPDEG